MIGVGALMLAVRTLTDDRWAALACGLGVMLATLVFSGRGPGGSIVVPAPAEGQFSTGVVWTIAVPLLAAIIGGGMYAVLLLGWYAGVAWYWLFWQALGLWKPLALTLTTFATAITVYAVVTRLGPALLDGIRSLWKRRKSTD